MDETMIPLAINGAAIALAAIAIFVLITLIAAVKIVPQARAGIVERLGRYHRTLQPGLALLIPFVDRVLPQIDLREQVVTFPPQAVITEDNVNVNIDTVVYYTIIDPQGRDLRGRPADPGDRAADDHHAAQRDRLARPRGGADLPRLDQRAAARPCSTRRPASGASASTGSS